MRAVLKQLRKDKGMSQRQLSAKLGRAPSFFGRFERGDRTLEVFEFVESVALLGEDPVEVLRSVLHPPEE
jgi:transcriptional regulator with XRE-family HTH domain